MSSNDSSVKGARYSAINAAEHCPLSAWLTYSQNKKGYKNPWAELGIIIHEVLEKYGKHCLKNKTGTDYEYFDFLISDSLTKSNEKNIKDLKYILNNVKDTTNFEELLSYPVVDLEGRIAIDENLLYDDLSQYYSGGIDLLYINNENILCIEDYKSVRKIYTNSYMEESLQRKAYSYLAYQKYKDTFEIKGVRFRFNFVRYGYLSEWYESSIQEVENDFKELLNNKINDHYKLMASKEAPEAKPSGFCILCENKGLCDSYKNAFSIDEQIKSESDAQTLVNTYRLAKMKLDSIKDILEEYVEAHGPIKLNKEEWGPQVSESLKFKDISTIIEDLKKKEIPIGAIYESLSTNKTELTKLFKKFKVDNDDKNKMFEKFASKSYKTSYKFKDLESDSEKEEEYYSEEVFDPYV